MMTKRRTPTTMFKQERGQERRRQRMREALQQKKNPEGTNTDGEKSGEENDVDKKKQQLSQLLKLLKKSSMADGPVMAHPWAARFHATGGIPPRLLVRIQHLTKPMESDNNDGKVADETTPDEAKEADCAKTTDESCTEREQMRQLRRLLRGAGGPGPHQGQRMWG